MKRQLIKFPTEKTLVDLIDSYFIPTESEHTAIKTKAKVAEEKEPEPATLAGLALHLGFSSREEFEDYEARGKFKQIIKRARLRIEVGYEKKLHHSSPSGAIFALKNLGWNEKTENKKAAKIPTTLRVKIIETGPLPVANEKEVIL